jgi:hypothetical protein
MGLLSLRDPDNKLSGPPMIDLERVTALRAESATDRTIGPPDTILFPKDWPATPAGPRSLTIRT